MAFRPRHEIANATQLDQRQRHRVVPGWLDVGLHAHARFRSDPGANRRGHNPQSDTMILESSGEELISPPIWVDLQATDWNGLLRLDFPGTVRSLDEYGITLSAGRRLLCFDEDADVSGNVDDLVAVVVAIYDEDEGRWVADVDWENVVHVSMLTALERDMYRKFRPQSIGKA